VSGVRGEAPIHQAGPTTIRVEAARYLSAARVERVKPELEIGLSDRCYLPRLDDLASDWVAHVAVPALRALRAGRGGASIPSFCSIGTGSGLDVLAAIEVLGASRVGLTDLHDDVVSAAVENVRRNYAGPESLAIEAGAGDLLEPLRCSGARYDVIYENLPNLRAARAEEVSVARRSGTHLSPRQEAVPPVVERNLLVLHYLALRQTRDFLRPGGVVLSTLGVRVPLAVFPQMAAQAGLSASFLTYGWKVQAEPESVLADHAALQRDGLGPFHFYRADALARRFAGLDPAASGRGSFAIEDGLRPQRLDAVTAYDLFKRGVTIGHTVVVLKSEPA
jgi:methylase of polypeptide subunit release factors